MPRYDYRCPDCKFTRDVVEHRDSTSEHLCPCCFSRMKRVPSLPAVHFKGSGFYVNDSRKKKDEDK